MLSRHFCFSVLLSLLPALLLAQQPTLHGMVVVLQPDGREAPAVGATVRQLNSANGTLTDATGHFALPLQAGAPRRVVVSYPGYDADTLDIPSGHLRVSLSSGPALQEVEVTARAKSLRTDPFAPIKSEEIGIRELAKAACCNLGESFETNPSVDVNYADGATGARQIQLLGLAGQYTQILSESLPLMQGLGRTYGLSYIPGPWIQSIQVSKGVGSVVQGYEATTGQINVTYKKPDFERLHLNGYYNNQGRIEGNLLYAAPLTPALSTVFMAHSSNMSQNLALQTMDRNGDGFADQAMPSQFNVANHYQWRTRAGWQGEFGVQALRETRLAGEMHYLEREPMAATAYQIRIQTDRLEAFNKTGYVWPNAPYRSIGLQLATVLHNQDGRYGIRTYDGRQRTAYANLIYQDIIGTTDHQWRAGLSFRYDRFREGFRPADTLGMTPPAPDGHGGHLPLPPADPALQPLALARDERVPGAFVEYTYTYLDRWTVLAGLRVDRNSVFGTFVTPRLHIRYAPNALWTIRASAGRAYRAANIFADNPSVLASSRQIVVRGPLRAEEAWNYGVNVTRQLRLWRRFGSIGLDLYRTDFVNQVVLDRELTYRTALFENLNGRSFSNAVQLTFDYELLPDLDLRFAYKLYDVQTTYGGELLQQPLTPQHRVLVNLAYETKHWRFDATTHTYSRQRLMNTSTVPTPYRRPDWAPAYAVVNGQVTRRFGKLEWYLGVENLLDFRQRDPLTAPDQPFGPYFDSGFTWGPVMGRVIYTGFRYSIANGKS